MIGFLVFILGLIIGSFMNVCIHRIPLKESIVKGSSHCPICKTPIKWYDLVPVLSYIMLKGKCRTCKTRISPRYLIIELTNGLGWLLFYLYYDLTLITVILCLLFSTLIVYTFIKYNNIT